MDRFIKGGSEVRERYFSPDGRHTRGFHLASALLRLSRRGRKSIVLATWVGMVISGVAEEPGSGGRTGTALSGNSLRSRGLRTSF